MLDIPCMIQQDLPNKWFACTSYLKKRHSARNICQKTRCPLRNGLWLSSFRGNRSETSNLLMIQRSKCTYCKATIVCVWEKFMLFWKIWCLNKFVIFIYAFLSVEHLQLHFHTQKHIFTWQFSVQQKTVCKLYAFPGRCACTSRRTAICWLHHDVSKPCFFGYWEGGRELEIRQSYHQHHDLRQWRTVIERP